MENVDPLIPVCLFQKSKPEGTRAGKGQRLRAQPEGEKVWLAGSFHLRLNSRELGAGDVAHRRGRVGHAVR